MRIIQIIALFALHLLSISAEAGIAYSFDGEVLVLKTEKGGPIRLKNSNCNDGPERCIKHRFRGTIADDQFYYVDTGFYEGVELALYSYKSGTKTEIYAEPHLSTQGTLIVTALGDEASNYTDNGVFVFEIVGGELKEIFRYQTKDYALYRFKNWESQEKAIIELTVWCKKSRDKTHNIDATEFTRTELVTLDILLTRTAKGWQLDQENGRACIESTK